jgi:hypothetical protein
VRGQQLGRRHAVLLLRARPINVPQEAWCPPSPPPPIPPLTARRPVPSCSRSRLASAGQRDRSLFYHPASLEEVIWQADQSMLRVSLGEDTWALTRSGVTRGGRLEMAFARANVGGLSAPLMVAHIDVDQEGKAAHTHAAPHSHPHPRPRPLLL